MTALDLIKQALRLIGVIEGEGVPTGAEGSDALNCLNQMVGEWNNEGLIPFSKTSATFSVTANTPSYLIGTGQTWNADRPIKIEQAYITSGGVDYEMKQITLEEYKSKPYKTNISTSIPSEFVYKADYPSGTVTLWPVPNSSLTVTLITLTKLSTYTQTTTIALPPGYESALKYNLALELAAEYLIDPKEMLIIRARESKANIKRLNSTPLETMSFEPAITSYFGRYDITSDTYL